MNQVTARDTHQEIPATFALHGNYPNPFHQSTSILLDLPQHAHVRVVVHDMLGRTVLSSPVVHMHAGWDQSLDISLPDAAAGVYAYSVIGQTESGQLIKTGQLVLIE